MPRLASIVSRLRTCLLGACCLIAQLALTQTPPVTVSFMGGYNPDTPEAPSTRQILALTEQYPQLRPTRWGGLWLPGSGGRAPLLLGMAGGNAPDIYNGWFHILRTDINNGFLAPMNDWLGEDTNGNGQLDDAEAKWPGWQSIPPLWRRVATKDGKVYGLPSASVSYYGIIYRKDLVQAAGIDPEYIPQTWEAFFDWCQRLTAPSHLPDGISSKGKFRRGQRGFGISPAPWNWLPWMQAAGGSPIVQHKDGETYPMEANLEDSTWEANFDSPEAHAAADFFHRLIWQPWVYDTTGQPKTLSQDEIASGHYPADQITYGVARPLPLVNSEQAFVLGEIAAMFAGMEAMERLTTTANIDPELIGMMPFPAYKPGMKRLFQAHRHFWCMSEATARRPKADRDLIFAAIAQLASPALNDADIKARVLQGHARWCHPKDLVRLGLTDYLDEIPPVIAQLYADLDAGIIESRTEPFVGFWQGVSDLIQRHFLEILLSKTGQDFDYHAVLDQINQDANQGVMFARPQAEINRYRPFARVILGLAIALILGLALWVWRKGLTQAKPAIQSTQDQSPHALKIVTIMLAPALLSITVWSYYPLIKGVLIAFQDYKIVGESAYIGLDNFITVATDPNFHAAIWRTIKYVALTLGFGFTTPIILAVLLCEIPRGKVFFRTLYFLPHLTSTLVVTLLWRMMYDPTKNGMLNQLLMMCGFESQAWLQDPALAMICCIVPGVWAGAGMSSLIYIAALQALPADYYEAAAIDGAGFWQRIRHILYPQLLPLMVINFVGAFIASFQSIGAIFLLTFGGPGDTTNVLSLMIWKEAYNNLRLGSATTMAWFLGTSLICFTYLQFRILRKVEFRRADTN